MTQRKVDYNRCADSYDTRYERYKYEGVEKTILAFVGEDITRRVLEVGCGTGFWLSLFHQKGFMVSGLDSSSEMVQRARAKIPEADLKTGSANSFPWPDAYFDRIICINAFHHFDKKKEFLQEAFRVLRSKGGVLSIGLDPNTDPGKWCVYEYFPETLKADSIRYPAARVIRSWMSEIGFVNCETVESHHILIEQQAEQALAEGRLDRTTTSQLMVITDEEYRQGIESIRQDIKRYKENGQELRLIVDVKLYATEGWVL